jgi:hypothetical protein
VFISYGRKDRRHLDDLKDHAADLVRGKRVEFFDDTRIEGGDEWSPVLEGWLNNAEIFMILVTRKSMSSKFCMRKLDVAMSRGLVIIPVSVESYLVTEDNPLSRFQYVPNGGPISGRSPEGEASAWKLVVKRLQSKAYRLRSAVPPNPAGEFGKVISLEARQQRSVPPSVTLAARSHHIGSEVIAVLEAARFSGTDWRSLAVSTRELRAVLSQQRTAQTFPARAAELAAVLQQTLDSILQPLAQPAAVHRALEQCELLRRWLIDALTEV